MLYFFRLSTIHLWIRATKNIISVFLLFVYSKRKFFRPTTEKLPLIDLVFIYRRIAWCFLSFATDSISLMRFS